jgi:hypothetical protein
MGVCKKLNPHCFLRVAAISIPRDCVIWAGGEAGAAINASFCVYGVVRGAFLYGFCGAFGNAGTASGARIGDCMGHIFPPQMATLRIKQNGKLCKF